MEDSESIDRLNQAVETVIEAQSHRGHSTALISVKAEYLIMEDYEDDLSLLLALLNPVKTHSLELRLKHGLLINGRLRGFETEIVINSDTYQPLSPTLSYIDAIIQSRAQKYNNGAEQTNNTPEELIAHASVDNWAKCSACKKWRKTLRELRPYERYKCANELILHRNYATCDAELETGADDV